MYPVRVDVLAGSLVLVLAQALLTTPEPNCAGSDQPPQWACHAVVVSCRLVQLHVCLAADNHGVNTTCCGWFGGAESGSHVANKA